MRAPARSAKRKRLAIVSLALGVHHSGRMARTDRVHRLGHLDGDEHRALVARLGVRGIEPALPVPQPPRRMTGLERQPRSAPEPSVYGELSGAFWTSDCPRQSCETDCEWWWATLPSTYIVAALLCRVLLGL